MIIFAFFCINICIYIIVRRSIHILQNYWFLIGYFFQRTDFKYVFIGVIYCIVFFIWGREKGNIWKRLEDGQRQRRTDTQRQTHRCPSNRQDWSSLLYLYSTWGSNILRGGHHQKWLINIENMLCRYVVVTLISILKY